MPYWRAQLGRREHHHRAEDREQQGRGPHQRPPAQPAQGGQVAPQVVPGERQVTGLLGDVDAHDALQQRVGHAGAPLVSLHVVDGVLATHHEQEEQGGEPAAERHHEAGQELGVAGHAGHVEPAAVDELLEHERVLRFLDDLVVGVAELRGGGWGARTRTRADRAAGRSRTPSPSAWPPPPGAGRRGPGRRGAGARTSRCAPPGRRPTAGNGRRRDRWPSPASPSRRRRRRRRGTARTGGSGGRRPTTRDPGRCPGARWTASRRWCLPVVDGPSPRSGREPAPWPGERPGAFAALMLVQPCHRTL